MYQLKPSFQTFKKKGVDRADFAFTICWNYFYNLVLTLLNSKTMNMKTGFIIQLQESDFNLPCPPEAASLQPKVGRKNSEPHCTISTYTIIDLIF